ncbi:MAG: hypothetical protein FWF02_07580, partial [Micrococcales bacterium]|nr:hypothetical protein [Micrococcales bacterium]
PETGSTPVAITLADFPLVPGDKIQGVTTVDAVNLTLDAKGTHLKAEVSELSVKSNASTAVEWLRADADVVDGEVVVTIEFPYDKDNNYATESGHPVAVNLGKLTVTVTQVRPALD